MLSPTMDITAEVLDSKIENSLGNCKVHAVLRMSRLPIPHINFRLLAAGVIPSPPPPPLRSEPLRGMAYAPLLGILDMALQKTVDAAIALKIERCPKLSSDRGYHVIVAPAKNSCQITTLCSPLSFEPDLVGCIRNVLMLNNTTMTGPLLLL